MDFFPLFFEFFQMAFSEKNGQVPNGLALVNTSMFTGYRVQKPFLLIIAKTASNTSNVRSLRLADNPMKKSNI